MANRRIADVFSDFRSNGIAIAHRYDVACDGTPGLSAVRQQIKEAGLKKLEYAMSGKPEQEVDRQLDILAKQEAEILRESVHVPRYLCAACKDTGTVGNSYCTCLLDQIYHECYNAIDIKNSAISFGSFDFSIFDDEAVLADGKTQRGRMELYMRHAKKYIDEYPATVRKNLLFMGKAGLGKSYLLYAMAEYAKEKGLDTLLIRANDLFSLFHAHRMGEEVDLGYLHKAKLLMVDDIGTEPITQNVSNEYFYELIERRLKNGLHTVFATNVDDLQKRYDDRIASRLKSKEDTLQFIFEGNDLRIQ